MGNTCPSPSAAFDAKEGDRNSWNAQYRRRTTEQMTPRATSVPGDGSVRLQRNKDNNVLQSVNEYQMTKQLGKGSFGDVYLALRANDKFAIKALKKSALRRQRQGRFGSALDSVKAEIALMKKIRHPNCVGMVEVIDDPAADDVFIVLEFVDGGPSQHMGKDGKATPLREQLIWSHTRHLVLGLEYLHMNGIVHRDIKPENLLVSKRDGGMLKIADFGTAVLVESAAPGAGGQASAGTPAFFSPEMCDSAQAGTYDGRMCDMWAVGVTLHLWAFGEAPFTAATPMLVMEAIKGCAPVVDLPGAGAGGGAGVSGELRDCMRAMLTKDFEKRLTLNQLRLHDWLTRRGRQPLVTQPTTRVHVSEKEIANAITPLMQVTGHAGALARSSATSVAKRTTRAEYNFYQSLAASDVAAYAPILYGATQANDSMSVVTAATLLDPADDSVRVLVQDLTAGMAAPCVMDIKMGTRTMRAEDLTDTQPRADLLKKLDAINPREARPEERRAGGVTKARYLSYRDTRSSTATLGFRIDAAVVSAPGSSGAGRPLDVNFKELKDEAKIRAALRTYLQDSRVLCRAVLIKLQHMRAALERSHFFKRHAFVRSSILITYDNDAYAELAKAKGSAEDFISMASPTAIEVKMIDFASSYAVKGGAQLTHRQPWQPGSDEDGYLTGLDNLVRLLEALLPALK